MTDQTSSGRLVLVRHGQSTWNLENRFTGWRDVPLTPHGTAEARKTGQRLIAANIRLDRAYVSALLRAQQTLREILDVIGQSDLSTVIDPSLNERDYGALTGLNKDDARREFGVDQVHIWRRSYDVAPPEGESLKDTADRTLPWFRTHILPAAQNGETVLVVAHGNSLRAIVMELEELHADDIVAREIATGEPLMYDVPCDGGEISGPVPLMG